MTKNHIDKYACPCCDRITLHQKPPGTFLICPVCDWEDDDVQFDDPTLSGGANKISLSSARQNFAEFGASDRESLGRVRAPLLDEIPK